MAIQCENTAAVFGENAMPLRLFLLCYFDL